jgi:3-mercaptopyruvate sulfurtransferase SseA
VAPVDDRAPKEWSGEVANCQVRRAGRIPRAKSVDWEWNLTSQEGVKVLKDTDGLTKLYVDTGTTKGKKILVCCRTGMRFLPADLALHLLGYPRVRNHDASTIEGGNRPELSFER